MCTKEFTQTTLESTLAVVFLFDVPTGSEGERISGQFRNIAMRHGVVGRLPACERMYSCPMIMHHGIFIYARRLLVSPTHPHKVVKNRDLGYYKPGKGTKRGFGLSGQTAGPLLTV